MKKSDLISQIEAILDVEEDSLEAYALAGGLDPAKDFENRIINNVDFSNENLTSFSFRNSDLRGSKFDGAYIQKESLKNALYFDMQFAKSNWVSASKVKHINSLKQKFTHKNKAAPYVIRLAERTLQKSNIKDVSAQLESWLTGGFIEKILQAIEKQNVKEWEKLVFELLSSSVLEKSTAVDFINQLKTLKPTKIVNSNEDSKVFSPPKTQIFNFFPQTFKVINDDQTHQKRKRDKRRPSYDRTAALESVQKEISYLNDLALKKQWERMDQSLATLVKKQIDLNAHQYASMTLGNTASQIQDEDNARIELCQLAIKLNPDDVVALTAYAESLRTTGRYEEALESFKSVQERFPENVFAHNAYSEALRSLGRYEEALASYKKTQVHFPDDFVAPTAHAETLRSLGRYEEALDAFMSTIKQFPDNPVAYNAYGEALRSMGRYEEALYSYKKTQEKFPDNVIAQTAYAETLRSMGRYEEALSYFKATQEKFPDNVVAQTAYGETLRSMGRYEEALRKFRDTLKQFPENIFTHNAYSQTLRSMGRYEEALASYMKTQNLFPNDPVSRNAYGDTLCSLGRYQESLDSLKVTQERFPNNIISQNAYAKTLRLMGRVQESIEKYEEILIRWPNERVTRNALARALIEVNRFEDARKHLQVKKQICESDWRDLNVYALGLWKNAQRDQAVKLATKGLSSPFKENRMVFSSILAFWKLQDKNYQDAINSLSEGETIYEDSNIISFAKFMKAHAYGGLSKRENVDKELSEISDSNNAEIIQLKSALEKRFINQTPLNEIQIEELDNEIYKLEFGMILKLAA